MSFYQANNMLTSLSSNASFDEDKWVNQISQTLDEELGGDTDVPMTIFAVPKLLMITDPESYIPQLVAIGPYHHLRPELYEMERYKVSAVKRFQKELKNIKVKEFVDHLIKYELWIRASYHRPLICGCKTLVWMMVIDASFLLEFFQVCGVRKGKILTRALSRLAYLVGLSGNKTMHNLIFKDITMLENQIPLFVVRMLLEFQLSSQDITDEVLLDMLLEVSQELSPFKMAKLSKQIEIKDCAHILDFLYCFIASEVEVSSYKAIEIHHEIGEEEEGDNTNKGLYSKGHVRQLLQEVWKIVYPLKHKWVNFIKRIIFSKPLKVVVKLTWTIITKIPIVGKLRDLVEHMFATYHGKDKEDGNQESSSNNLMPKSPLFEEITIPSVTQLADVGVEFVPTEEGINSITFDPKSQTLSMPVVELDVNSEVVLRNLVAYEACTVAGPLVLARYTELMNGIIDTESDVQILSRRES